MREYARRAARGLGLVVVALGLVPSVHAQAKPLQVWVSSETDAGYYRKMAELYRTKKKPGFAAEVHAFGYTEMPDKLAAAIKTGVSAPDVVQLDQIFFSLYLRGPVPFLDLTSRVKAAHLDEALLKQRQALFTFGGKTYGLPQSVSAIVLYYREDLLAKAGLSAADLETWDKVVAAGKKVKAAGGPSLLSLDWSYFEILLRQRGYDLFDDSGAPKLDARPAVETLEWLVQLARERVGLNPDRGTIFEPAFFSGDVAAGETVGILGADWYGLDMIQGLSPETKGKWRAVPLPAWTGAGAERRRTSVFAGEGLLVYRETKRADEAWDFIRFVMEDVDANVERYLQGNCFTAFRPAWTDPRLKKPEPFFGGQSLATLIGSLAPEVPLERASPYKAELVNLWREKYWSAVIGGRIPPAQALQEIQKELLRPR